MIALVVRIDAESGAWTGPIWDLLKESIMEVVQAHPESAEVFFKHGMHCLGCAASRFENINQGCEAHGIDSKSLVDDINRAISAKPKPKKA